MKRNTGPGWCSCLRATRRNGSDFARVWRIRRRGLGATNATQSFACAVANLHGRDYRLAFKHCSRIQGRLSDLIWRSAIGGDRADNDRVVASPVMPLSFGAVTAGLIALDL